MSLPWDDANLIPNLDTLARLRAGNHLSVLKEGENVGTVDSAKGDRGLRSRFQIEGKVRQAFVRRKKGETILDDQQYLLPLTTVFHAAIVKFFAGAQVSASQILGAFQGLLNLRRTYAGDAAKAQKMDQIIAGIRNELPMALMSCVFLEPGQHRFVLGRNLGPAIEQEILSQIRATSTQVRNEQTSEVNQALIDSVYGPGAVPQAATWVPVTQHNYTRTGIGVCEVFWRDAHHGYGVHLNGARLSCSAADLRLFRAFVHNDEGMLFAIAQTANQGSLSGAPTLILNQGVVDRGARVPLVQASGDRVFFSIGGGTVNITNSGAVYTVSTRLVTDGNNVAFSFRNGGMDPSTGRSRLVDFGITRFEFELAANLTRSGSRINLTLAKADFLVTTA